MLRKILNIGIILSVSAILLLILVVFYDDPSESDNGFDRSWLTTATDEIPIRSAPVDRTISRICGATDTRYYLAGQTPTQIWVVNKELKLVDTLVLNIPVPEKLIVPNEIIVDSPIIYIHINNMGTVLKSKFHSSIIDSTKCTIPVFMRSAQINDSTTVLYAYDHKNKRFSLFFVDIQNDTILEQKTISSSTGIAGFVDDGILLYNEKKSILIYLHYYRNKFIRMNSEADIEYYGKTIDTITQPIVKIVQRGGSKKANILPANSRLTVNKKAALNDKYLIILSGLKSRNQSVSDFRSHNIFDTYNIQNGAYVGSFMLPKRKGQKVQSMYLQGSMLVVLYTNGISSYHLNI